MILSIIIPVYNESAYIAKVIDTLYQLKFPPLINNFELIIVDDASQDRSFAIVEKIASKKEEISLISHFENRGKGAAIKTALKQVKGDLIIVQDADLELSPYDIPKMIEYLLENKLNMVNGSRFLDNFMHASNSFLRNSANKLFSLFASVLLNKKITDLTCGYKLFTYSLLKNISLKEERFGIEAELLIKAIKFDKEKVGEFPVYYKPRELSEGKKIRAIDSFGILWTIIKYAILK
jgi:glycosyltransferase involved in cell wall biosynthesis